GWECSTSSRAGSRGRRAAACPSAAPAATTAPASWSSAWEGFRIRPSLWLSELARDELPDGFHALARLLSLRAHLHHRSARSAKQEHAHDALAVGGLIAVGELDLAWETRRDLHQLRGRAGVQTEVVDDCELVARLVHRDPPLGTLGEAGNGR